MLYTCKCFPYMQYYIKRAASCLGSVCCFGRVCQRRRRGAVTFIPCDCVCLSLPKKKGQVNEFKLSESITTRPPAFSSLILPSWWVLLPRLCHEYEHYM